MASFLLSITDGVDMLLAAGDAVLLAHRRARFIGKLINAPSMILDQEQAYTSCLSVLQSKNTVCRALIPGQGFRLVNASELRARAPVTMTARPATVAGTMVFFQDCTDQKQLKEGCMKEATADSETEPTRDQD
jgi:hypothetical protein